jgi:hypothetical protein
MISKRLILNNKDRNIALSQSSSHFIINLKDSFHLQSVQSVAVESCTLTNLVYNINETNNTIRWTEGAGPIITRSLPSGQYTLTEFMDELIVQLNSIGSAVFNVVQDVVTKKIVITNATISFFILGESTINPVLGLPSTHNSVSVVGGGTNTLNCDYTPNLGGTDTLYLHSKALSEWNSITSSAGSTSIISYISFHDTPFGGTATRFITDTEGSMINFSIPRNLQNIDLKVRDANGNIVDLQNSEIIIVLKAYLSEN